MREDSPSWCRGGRRSGHSKWQLNFERIKWHQWNRLVLSSMGAMLLLPCLERGCVECWLRSSGATAVAPAAAAACLATTTDAGAAADTAGLDATASASAAAETVGLDAAASASAAAETAGLGAGLDVTSSVFLSPAALALKTFAARRSEGRTLRDGSDSQGRRGVFNS